jgi:copper transport protein
MARVEGERVEGAVVQRFSRMATVAFPLAVLTGGLMLWQVLPALEDLVDTTYGRLLVAKMVVVATAGVAAYLNRMRVVRAFRAGRDRTPLLRRLLAVEIGALICVVGLTATLTGQPPGSARNSDQTAGSAPYVSDQFVGPYHVVVSLAPRQVGTNSLTVDFHAISEEGETPPVAATAEFVVGDAAAGTLVYVLENTAGSRFAARTVELTIEGEWKLRLRVQIGESEQEEATFTIRIPR